MAAICGSTNLPIIIIIIIIIIITIFVDKGTIGVVDCYPIQAPDLRNCVEAVDESVLGPPINVSLNCCVKVPGNSSTKNFSWELYGHLPSRVRTAAHRASPERVEQYERAYELMRALPADDPRSLSGQANFHCSFCNGALKQAGFNASGDIAMQIHFSSIFLPWHRWYLFFHERILANLVGDPSFSLVFWNWDDQRDGGNVFPAMFARNGTALSDRLRNPAILNNASALVNLVPLSNVSERGALVAQNLNSLHAAVVSANTPELFFGGPYRVGTDLSGDNVLDAPLGGSIENVQHDAIHHWTGDPSQALAQDMGTFSTAARDPVFYAHHANLDRLWAVWETLPGGERSAPADADFLDAEFEFFDERAELVKVRARDALDSRKLGIAYESRSASDRVWIEFEPNSTSANASAVEYARQRGGAVAVGEAGAGNASRSIDVGDGLIALVKRQPAEGSRLPNRSEALVVQGIGAARDRFVQMLVFVNLPDAAAVRGSTPPVSSAEYVGAFNVVPTASSNAKRIFVNAKFQLADAVRRLGLGGDDEIVVAVLVQPPDSRVTVEGMKIVYE